MNKHDLYQYIINQKDNYFKNDQLQCSVLTTIIENGSLDKCIKLVAELVNINTDDIDLKLLQDYYDCDAHIEIVYPVSRDTSFDEDWIKLEEVRKIVTQHGLDCFWVFNSLANGKDYSLESSYDFSGKLCGAEERLDEVIPLEH